MPTANVVHTCRNSDSNASKMTSDPKWLTARVEGGTHDGEEFDITEETVGLLLNSRRTKRFEGIEPSRRPPA